MFNTFKVFASEFEQSNISLQNNTRYDKHDKNNKYSVDVRYFGLFFALQLFTHKTKFSVSMDTNDKINWKVNY